MYDRGKRVELEDRRVRSRLSQMKLASILGISQGGYSNIENGYADPPDEVASKLVEMFDLHPDYFKPDETDQKGA